MNNLERNLDRPLVSFVLPCYNVPLEQLKECLDSILSLSLKESEREILLIDDGSNTPVIEDIKEYSNSIIYIRQENKGLSVARNTGLSASTGCYIQFIDSDDKLISKTYESCLQIIKKEHPDMVLFQFTQKDFKNSTGSREQIDLTDGVHYMLSHNIHGSAWGYIFLKDIARGLNFTPGILHEDEEFTPQLLLRAKKIYVTSFLAYFYRKRSGSITRDLSKENLNKRFLDLEGVILRLKEKSLELPHEPKLALERRVAQLTMDYLYNVARFTHNISILEEHIEKLREKGLFPLPNKNYTKTYTIFRRILNNTLLRNLFVLIAPK